MKKRLLCITAVCLVISMLSGCAAISEYFDRLSQLLGLSLVDFQDMEYVRPDMEKFRRDLDTCCADAAEETNFDDAAGPGEPVLRRGLRTPGQPCLHGLWRKSAPGDV